MNSRIPLHIQKALSGGAAGQGTDYKIESAENVASIPADKVISDYRVPAGRQNGNELFRRYPDGTLDLEHAKHIVIDALNKVRNELPLTEIEKVILTVGFPTVFSYVDHAVADKLRQVNLRLSSMETMIITTKVAAHLAEEVSYATGQGKGV